LGPFNVPVGGGFPSGGPFNQRVPRQQQQQQQQQQQFRRPPMPQPYNMLNQ